MIGNTIKDLKNEILVILCMLPALAYSQVSSHPYTFDNSVEKVESPFRLLRGLKGDTYQITSTLLVGYEKKEYFNDFETYSYYSRKEKKIWRNINRF